MPAAAPMIATTELQIDDRWNPKNLREKERCCWRKSVKKVSQDRAEKETSRDKGQIFGGDDKVQEKNWL